MKICPQCKELLPLSSFQPDHQRHDGRRSWCRRCRKKKEREYVEQWAQRRASAQPPVDKKCSKCSIIKPISEFTKDCCRPDGFHVWCRACRNPTQKRHKENRKKRDPVGTKEKDRKRSLKANYGLTIEDFDRMAASQNGKCAICQQKEKLHVDHSHATKAVRGLLCSLCNKGIGLLKDSPEICLAAARYLQGWT